VSVDVPSIMRTASAEVSSSLGKAFRSLLFDRDQDVQLEVFGRLREQAAQNGRTRGACGAKESVGRHVEMIDQLVLVFALRTTIR
jgi:hypothetical protein